MRKRKWNCYLIFVAGRREQQIWFRKKLSGSAITFSSPLPNVNDLLDFEMILQNSITQFFNYLNNLCGFFVVSIGSIYF